MSDKFHQELRSIISILKTSPISITIENIQRLSNIYNFETFVESISDDLIRLSIAGKIIVIDLDYSLDRVVKQGLNTMTFFHIKDMKLILANNYNEFDYLYKGENILVESLKNHKDLDKFNKILEKLMIFDQFSDEKTDLFKYYMDFYHSLAKDERINEVVLNYDYDFDILIEGFVEMKFVNDDKLNLEMKLNDIGIEFKFVPGEIVIPKSYLIESGALFDEIEITDEEERLNELLKFKTRDNNSEMFLNDEKCIDLNVLKFFTKDLIIINSIKQNQLSIPFLIKVINFTKIIKFINTLISTHFKTVNKYDKLNSIDFNLQLFKEFENGDDASKQDNYLTISLTEEYASLKSNLVSFNTELRFEEANFSQKLNALNADLENVLCGV